MFKIVALYKTWDGGEFIDASLASIYDSVSAIVMVHSDISWLNEEGNTVKDKAIRWCKQFDKESKVHHLEVSLNTQEAQYQVGLDYIDNHHIEYDVIMVVDADEIWEKKYIDAAIPQMIDCKLPAYRSNMHTYLKSPYFRVSPPYGSPTVFLKEPKYLTESARGCKAPALHLSNVWMHHLTYVRETRELVEQKIRQSCLADNSNETVVDNFMSDIYDKLPDGENLHGFVKHRSKWSRIEKLAPYDLPSVMRNAELIKLWMPDGELLDGEINVIYNLTKEKAVAVDLGTYQGLSATILSLACHRVYTYDCYEDLPDGAYADTIDPKRYFKRNEHSLEANTQLAKRLGNVTAIKSRSIEAADTWNNGPVDILFVDDDHSESAVLGAVRAWRRHLHARSIIIFHDNNDIHPGVQNAIRHLRANGELRLIKTGEWAGSLCAGRLR